MGESPQRFESSTLRSMKNFAFSIIIPTLNEEESLPVLLQTIATQSYKNFEVIIADCFSKDKTRLVALSFKDRIGKLIVIQKKFKNVSQARNYGASLAKNEFLIFFDADIKIEKKFLEEINKKANLYNLDALTVWNRAEKGIKGKFIFTLMNISMTLFQKIKPAANGPCIIVKKRLFKKAGGFDEEITFGEDFDLIQRLVRNGAKFGVFSKPILYVSTRRFEKEGLILSLYKSLKAIYHQLFLGPIKKPIFEYKMGGDYYKS